MSRHAPDPEDTVRFFESTAFDEQTKDRAADLSQRINALLHDDCNQCKAANVSKQVWLDSTKLTLAACLKMRVDIQP